MSSAYTKTVSPPITCIIWSSRNSLITFSGSKLNKVEDDAFFYHNPELTSKAGESFSIEYFSVPFLFNFFHLSGNLILSFIITK